MQNCFSWILLSFYYCYFTHLHEDDGVSAPHNQQWKIVQIMKIEKVANAHSLMTSESLNEWTHQLLFVTKNTVLHIIIIVIKKNKLFCYTDKTKTKKAPYRLYTGILCAIFWWQIVLSELFGITTHFSNCQVWGFEMLTSNTAFTVYTK